MAKKATAAAIRQLTVRMYRDILGDCFLIRTPKGDGMVNVLIDCGILQGMPGAATQATRIMKDIAETTGNRLDVLIVTHEHWDHLSGFDQAKTVFSDIIVSELWLAWTEDPRDELARKLAEGRGRALNIVWKGRRAAMAMAKPRRDVTPELEALDEEPLEDSGFAGILAFAGIGGEDLGANAAAAARSKTAAILDLLRAKAERVRYFTPSIDPVPVAGLTDLRAFILGPPRDAALMKRSAPRKGTEEVYQLAAGDVDDLFHLAALDDSADETSATDAELTLPFGKRLLLRRPPAPGSAAPGPEEDEARRYFRAVYEEAEDDWRKIDNDWLLAGEQLALKLDNDTNNTSLAIAFEVGTGKDARVLLFPGDAQVGNWLSWSSLTWVSKDADGKEIRRGIEDLLARTILYKVGHHGSHNATLRERGLELMTSRDLVAMVPVVESFANDAAKKWNMPFPSLLSRLEEKTGRRVIRADGKVADFATVADEFADKPGELSAQEWARFRDAVREIVDQSGPIAIEFAIGP